MARTVRDANLETRTARARLKASGKPYYRSIDPGLHLGYRKGKTGGRWVARWYVGERQYKVETIEGVADDHDDADGQRVFSFAQAQAAARKLAAAAVAAEAAQSAPAAAPLTVKRVCESYIEFLKAERATADDAEKRLAKHIYPALGDRLVAALTTAEIEAVKRAMVWPLATDAKTSKDGKGVKPEKGASTEAGGSKEQGTKTAKPASAPLTEAETEEIERRKKDSANRVLSMLKAALNRAFEDEANKIPTDAAWRRVKPFRDVGRARQVHLDAAQANRLINATEGAFRRLIIAALLTGARAPGELVGLKVRDFNHDLGTLSVDGKTGRRDIVLTAEATQWFTEITAGRSPDALLLPKDDGTAWGKNHHVRPMQEAVKRAKLSADTTIYSLRHTCASQSLLAGMNLKMLAENMGTSVRMIELHYGKFLASSRRKMVEDSAFKLGLEPGNVETLKVPA